jgi:hypothetical protein
MSMFMGRNRRPVVPRVLDPDSRPQAFRRAGGQSHSLNGRQHRYSYDTTGIAAGFEGVIMGIRPLLVLKKCRFHVPTYRVNI